MAEGSHAAGVRKNDIKKARPSGLAFACGNRDAGRGRRKTERCGFRRRSSPEMERQCEGEQVSASAGTQVFFDVAAVQVRKHRQKRFRREGLQQLCRFPAAGLGRFRAAAADHIGVRDARDQGEQRQDRGVVQGQAVCQMLFQGREGDVLYGRKTRGGFAPDPRDTVIPEAAPAVGVRAGGFKIIQRAPAELRTAGENGGESVLSPPSGRTKNRSRCFFASRPGFLLYQTRPFPEDLLYLSPGSGSCMNALFTEKSLAAFCHSANTSLK